MRLEEIEETDKLQNSPQLVSISVFNIVSRIMAFRNKLSMFGLLAYIEHNGIETDLRDQK